jgi:hypothetical protein
MPNIPISSLPLTTSVCSNGLIPIVQNGVTFSTYSCLVGTSGGGCGGNINCIIAGTGISISPSTGVGDVTVCATGSGGTGNVTSIIAGCAIVISPSGGTGNVTICATGGAAMVEGIGICSIVGNCSENNNANGDYSFVGAGCNNTASACAPYSFIAGGFCNQVNSCYGAILGGFGNTVNAPYSGAFGCCINANNPCTFYVNNFIQLSPNMPISGIANGCAICINDNGILTGYTQSASGGLIVQGTGSGSTTVNYGCFNIAQGACSSVIGGVNNQLYGSNSFAVGNGGNDGGYASVILFSNKSCLCAVEGTTYVENLSIQGINCGCAICVGANQNTLVGYTFTPTPDVLSVGTGCNSVIRCGVSNVASSCGAFAGVGCNNCVSNIFSNITGGSNNFIQACNSSILGGFCNSILCTAGPAQSGSDSFIGGGFCNCTASGDYRWNTIGGGGCNIAGGNTSPVLIGGFKNIANGTIMGGECNVAGWFVGGGFKNCTCTSIVNGGLCNQASGLYNYIGGGEKNCICAGACYSSISGGYRNQIINFCNSNILSGIDNCINGGFSTITNGCCSCINCFYGFIGTGFQNTVSSIYNQIINGNTNTIDSNSGCSYILSGGGNSICCSPSSVIGSGIANKIGFQGVSNNQNSISNGYSNIINNAAINFIVNGCCNSGNGNGGLIVSGFCNIQTCNCSFQSVLGGSFNTTSACYASIFGCNIVNNTPCSFMSNRLIACNLFSAGAICADANGVISAVSSDIKIKKDILPLNYGINDIMSLNPISYLWKDEYKDNKGSDRKIGFVAQEVEKIVPEAVFNTTDGYYGLDDKSFMPIFAKSLQEIEIKLSELEREFDLISR